MLELRDHGFDPPQSEVVAGARQPLTIENQEASAEEFESRFLRREKILAPRSKTNLYKGPLRPGRYEFIGEFHPASAKGVVIVK